MTFLNTAMLLGFAAVAVPVLIHLLHRRQPRSVDWGAMQFLSASLPARSRRLQIEDGVLLCLRCLALACLALAAARPFVPGAPAVPWFVVMPGLLLAVLCVGIAATVWTREALRRRLLRTAVAGLAIAVSASLLEHRIQTRRWAAPGGGDTVVILDASRSMALAADGRTTFDRAVDEADAVVAALRPGDACAIILGGPAPRPLVAHLTADRDELRRALRSAACRPAGGAMDVPEALNLAGALLTGGTSASRTIVVLTDGQAAGWDHRADPRWQRVTSGFRALPAPPRILCRRIPSPKSFRNAVVSDLVFSRRVIGTDRPVGVRVTVANAGTAPLRPLTVELHVDGQPVDRASLGKDLAPRGADEVRFNAGFDTPGCHLVTARIVAGDDLPDDDALDQVIYVPDRLPVLIVEGSATERFFFRKTSSLIRSALMPRPVARDRELPAPEPASLVAATVVEASDAAAIPDLAPYRAVILADVPRLPAAVADRLAAFVKEGGGLLIAPGGRAEPAFYNAWQTPAGEPVTPARLGPRLHPDDPLRLDAGSLTHPALALVAAPDASDARFGLVSAYWRMTPHEAAGGLHAGARLESGDPWLAERQLGKGRVLMTSTALDRRDSNLPLLECFVPIVHEVVAFLAAPSLVSGILRPGTEWTLTGALPDAVAGWPGSNVVAVVLPDGDTQPVACDRLGRRFVIRCADTREPGLYRMRLPAALARAAGIASNSLSEALFTVRAPAGTTLTGALADADIAALRRHVNLFFPASQDELLMILSGAIPGQDLWRVLAVCALLILLAESALTRWIALNRRIRRPEAIVLRSAAAQVEDTRDRFAAWREAPARER